jgi:spore germination protein YaaH
VFALERNARIDSSLRANAAQLDGVVISEFQLDSVTGQPSELHSRDDVSLPTNVTPIALITTLDGERYHPETIRRLAISASARNLAASRAAALVARRGARIAILDFESQAKEDLPALLTVLRTMGDTLRAHGDSVGIQLSGVDTAAYPTAPLLALADVLVIRLDNEHWSTSAPGVIASPLWVRRALANRVADVGPDRLVALLPVFSYVWHNSQPGELIGFTSGRRLASEGSVDVVRDPASQSLHAVQPGNWELWLTDTSLLNALEAEVRALGVQRLALRQLGLEDPDVWSPASQTISRSR